MVAAIAAGAAGWTVRCTPRRRTVMASLPDGRVLFGKLRSGRRRDARSEWHWLRLLAVAGFTVPHAVALREWRGGSLVCTAAVAGRPFDALWQEALQRGQLPRAVDYALAVVAPMVRRLHDAGLVHRDLYWNHLFGPGLDLRCGEPALLDVERVLRPRWRLRRWRIKDLAALRASLPVPVRAVDQLRFLRNYCGTLPADWRALAIAVVRKAARIRAHVPRFG